MLDFYRKIDEIIKTPLEEPTKEEARETLRSLGIIDENDELMPAFEGILFKRTDKQKD